MESSSIPCFGSLSLRDSNQFVIIRRGTIKRHLSRCTGGGIPQQAGSLSNLTGWITTTKPEGASCILHILWSSLEDDVPNGPGTLTVKVNNVVKKVVDIPQGEHEEDVSSYLGLGVNTIKLSIADVYGNSKTLNFRITVVTLGLKSNFDASIPYGGVINYTYTATGNIDKTVHFILDDEEIDSVVVSTNGRQSTYVIPKQPHGSHTFEVYFDAVINGETVTSNHLYYDLMCYDLYNETPIITTNFRDPGITQYSIVSIPYYVYTYGHIDNIVQLFTITYPEDSEPVWQQEGSDLTVKNGVQQIWSYKANTAGRIDLVIKSGTTVKYIPLDIIESGLDINPVTTDLALHLSSYGRSNTESAEARPVWKDGDIECTLEGFNWTSNGWIKKTETREPTEDDPSKSYISTVLRVNGGAKVTIPYQPFKTTTSDRDIKITGKTIEFEFATSTVDNYEKPVISCYNGGIGFQVSAQQAMFSSLLSSVSSQYKEDEHVRVSFVISKRNEDDSYDSNGTRIMYIYVNGIISGAVQYPEENESFNQPTPQNITIGSDAATVDIYNIRIYDNDLSRRQMVANWIADMQDNSTMVYQHKHNDIYGEDGVSIDYSRLPSDLPYMIVKVNDARYEGVGDVLPQSKTDKVTIEGRFVDPRDAEREKKDWRSFTFTGCEATTQGTSSQAYPIKNFKFKFSGGFKMANQAEDEEPKSKYAMNENAIATKTFVFKADFASSEGANNVELVRYYNDNCPAKTPPQAKNPKVRVGIDGFPVVMFQEYHDGTVKFIGKYNFNNHKGTEDVYGLNGHGAEYNLDKKTKVASVVSEGIPDESWEFCDNNNEIARFKRAAQGENETELIEDMLGPWGEGELAAHAFEVRYPSDWYDAHTDGYHPELVRYQRFWDLQKWVASTDTGDITYYDKDEKKLIHTGVPVWADMERTTELDEHDLETGALIYHGPLFDTPVVYQTVEYPEDNDAYRLAKFRNEFSKYFDKDASLYYYLYTETFLMIDSRVKNAFPAYFAITKKVQDVDPETGELVFDDIPVVDDEGNPIMDEETGEPKVDHIPRMHVEEELDETGWPKGRWTWLPYDMDTANGINNEGKLVFNYNLEDTDTINGNTVFNGQDSVIWNNIRMCFRSDLAQMYRDLRNDGFSYETIERNFETHQNAWPTCVFNDDAYFKYILPLLQTGENRLEMCLGSKEQQRKWWLYNRFRYLDSKYLSLLAEQTINFRAYSPGTLAVTPYADIYVRVKMGEAWMYAIRASKGERIELTADIDPNDTESYIYSADQLKEVEGLGNFLPDTIDISAAIRLQRLDLSASAIAPNTNLLTLGIDKNVQLKYLNLNNCVNFNQSLNLSNCINLEEVYLENTLVPSVSFPNGGFLKKIHLPKTISALNIKNHTLIDDLTIQGLTDPDFKLSTLVLENVSKHVEDQIITLLSSMDAGQQVRLIDIHLEFDTRAEADAFIRLLNPMRGLNDSDVAEAHAQVSGTIKVNEPVNYTYIQRVQFGGTDPDDGEVYPGYRQLEFDCQISKTIEFWNEDGSEEFSTYRIVDTLDTEITYGGLTPTKEETTDEFGRRWSYIFAGWSETPNGIANPHVLHNVRKSLKLYAAFTAVPYLMINFYDKDSTFLKRVDVLKGFDVASVEVPSPVDPEYGAVLGWATSKYFEEDPDILKDVQEDLAVYAIYDYPVNSITVTTQPTKISYYKDEIFDPTGMIVTANKEYLGDVEVKKYTYSTTPLTSSDTSVTITLEGKTDTVSIGMAESLKVHQVPTRLVFTVNEDAFDPAGLVLETTFSNGETELITYTETSGITWDNHDVFTEIKTYLIEISYKELSCILSVVSVDQISSILDENSWEVISALSADGRAQLYWSVGDEKTVPIDGSAYRYGVESGWSSGTWTFRIVAFDHNKDIESPDRHTTTFGVAQRILRTTDSETGEIITSTEEIVGTSTRFAPVAVNAASVDEIGSWKTETSIIRRVCEAFEGPLPAALRNVIIPVLKGQSDVTWTELPDIHVLDHFSTGTVQQMNRVYVPSYMEIFGTPYVINSSVSIDESAVCKQFEYYRLNNTTSSRIKHSDASGTRMGVTSDWWLRTFVKEYSFLGTDGVTENRYYHFAYVTKAGREANYYGTGNYGFAPFFTV